MEKEIPEWFDDLCLKATDRRMNLTDAKALWREISKPENAAKIPVVKGLIDAAKFSASEDMWESNGEYHERWSYQYEEWYQDKLNTALKLFKEEGSDEL